MNKKLSLPTNIINIIIMQVGWWSITLSVPNTFIYIGVTITLLLSHFIFCQKKERHKEFIFILLGTTFGCIADYLSISLNLYSPTNSYSFFPLWLICYWLLFTTSFSFSLNWLKNRWVLISILGFIFGPLTYYAGEKFNILKFNSDSLILSLFYYGLIWSVLYPVLFTLLAYVKASKSPQKQ